MPCRNVVTLRPVGSTYLAPTPPVVAPVPPLPPRGRPPEPPEPPRPELPDAPPRGFSSSARFRRSRPHAAKARRTPSTNELLVEGFTAPFFARVERRDGMGVIERSVSLAEAGRRADRFENVLSRPRDGSFQR